MKVGQKIQNTTAAYFMIWFRKKNWFWKYWPWIACIRLKKKKIKLTGEIRAKERDDKAQYHSNAQNNINPETAKYKPICHQHTEHDIRKASPINSKK